jgi:hypothetical protein
MIYGAQVDTARRWLNSIDREIDEVKRNEGVKTVAEMKRILTLRENQSIGWEDDHRWDRILRLAGAVLPGEPRPI